MTQKTVLLILKLQYSNISVYRPKFSCVNMIHCVSQVGQRRCQIWITENGEKSQTGWTQSWEKEPFRWNQKEIWYASQVLLKTYHFQTMGISHAMICQICVILIDSFMTFVFFSFCPILQQLFDKFDPCVLVNPHRLHTCFSNRQNYSFYFLCEECAILQKL